MKKITLILAAMSLLTVMSAYADTPGSDPLEHRLAEILAVLRTMPDAASDSCIESLKELHHTHDLITSQNLSPRDKDWAIVKDVLVSDYEETIQICGADARTLCRHNQSVDTRLRPLCLAIERRAKL